MALFDKHGREIMRGDILKVFHFTAALRRKKHYMYKQALDTVMLGKAPVPFLKISHLDLSTGISSHYWEIDDGRTLRDYEIVQSTGADFELRPRRAALGDRPHD